jgi:hypothetical protein
MEKIKDMKEGIYIPKKFAKHLEVILSHYREWYDLTDINERLNTDKMNAYSYAIVLLEDIEKLEEEE